MAEVLFMAIMLALTFVPQVLAITWSISAWKNYYSIIDGLWPVLVALLAAGYALMVPGYGFRKVILVIMVGLWAGRLSTHLFLRLKEYYPKEDPRYERLKTLWGKSTERNFFIFFQLQGLASVLLAIPFWIYIMHPSLTMHWTEYLGILLFFVALAGETIADEQLRRFKSDSKNKGRTLQSGLWKFSRHPNYFFEWLVWVAFATMAISAPRSGIAIFAPAVMLLALLRWTGVPANEKRAESSREDYEHYKSKTNVFFPWFPKQSA
jgi:steroid 5-alpha reductase family enzyme